jgi:hypothetical protein
VERTAIVYARGSEPPAPPPGLDVAKTILDPDGDQLWHALELIGSGAARTLYTPRLGAVAGSLGELVVLLQWLEAAGACLIAEDVRLDTGSVAGRRTTALLAEIRRWEREPEHPRRPRGRPGLSSASPELAERITAMRERGDSLHAIAEALNREGVPTPRGGSVWRASSVQSALGYRRPRPPTPGPKKPRKPHRPDEPHPPPTPHKPPGPPKPRRGRR